MEARKFRRYIEQAVKLPQQQRTALASALQGAFIISTPALIEMARGPVLSCPRCRACRLHRHGHAHGLQRYRCLGCLRTFNALTGTPLARLRKRGKWLPYLDCMLDSRTVRSTADRVGVHRNTSFRWRHGFLAGAQLDRDTSRAICRTWHC